MFNFEKYTKRCKWEEFDLELELDNDKWYLGLQLQDLLQFEEESLLKLI